MRYFMTEDKVTDAERQRLAEHPGGIRPDKRRHTDVQLAGFLGLHGPDTEFFPQAALPHIRIATVAWDRSINALERRVRVVYLRGGRTIFLRHTTNPLVRVERGGVEEIYTAPSGARYASLEAAVKSEQWG